MYLERLKNCLVAERGLRLTFSTRSAEESIELSVEAAEQTLQALQIAAGEASGQLTLTVLGHQVVRTPEAYGLLLRTQEFGNVVFSLPQPILKRLITDLTHLLSPPATQPKPGSGDARGDRRRVISARHT
jgi:hypothetical protein